MDNSSSSYSEKPGNSATNVEGDKRELKVYPPIHRLGFGGVWLRQQLLKGIVNGSPVLVSMQRLRSPLLNAVMKGVSFLGEEEFYTLLVPLVMWVWDARLGTLLALLMAMAFYCTGFLKNLLCLPRPPVPPVSPLQHSQDWSLPSHHALLSVNIPWYIWFYMTLHHPAPLSLSSRTLLFSCIALWSFLVMFSRMYLAVHSPADILSGGIVGCLLLAAWLQVDTTVDRLISTSGVEAIVVFTSVAMVMLYVHPDPKPTTIIYDETTSLVGVAWGVIISRALGPAYVMTAVMETKSASVWWLVLRGVLRYVVGLVSLVVVRTVVKSLATGVLTHLCRLATIPCVCQKRVSQVTSLKVHYSSSFITLDKPPVHPSAKPFRWSQQHPLNVQVAVRLLTYGSMGMVVVLLAPYIFTLLHI